MKSCPRSSRLQELGPGIPHLHREGVVVVDPGDGLHHASVAAGQAIPVRGLHATDVRLAELRDRDVLVAVDARRHGGSPQQLVTHVLVDELVQVEHVLQELPAGLEGRRYQLDQRLGEIRGDVFVGERAAQCGGVRRLRDAALGRDAQRLFLDALSATLQDARLTTIDEGRESLFELAIDGGAHEGRHLAGSAPNSAISLNGEWVRKGCLRGWAVPARLRSGASAR